MGDEAQRGLELAFDRIADFLAVQADDAGRVAVDAVNLLQEAVGIGDPSRVVIRERLEGLSLAEGKGPVLLGVILGLFAAELGVQSGQ
jgi:hypothetical protein